MQGSFLQEKMKRLGFRLTELAEFLRVSRPTAYRFIELFECGRGGELPARAARFLEFLDSAQAAKKPDILTYAAAHLLPQQVSVSKKEQIAALLPAPNETKAHFIELVASGDVFDGLLDYLCECAELLAKPARSPGEDARLAPLLAFYAALRRKPNAASVVGAASAAAGAEKTTEISHS